MRGLPSYEQILRGLERWRQEHKEFGNVKEIHKKFKSECKVVGLSPVEYSSFTLKIGQFSEKRSRKPSRKKNQNFRPFIYPEFEPLLKAHGITDWDTFVDYCSVRGVDDVIFISSHNAVEKITSSSGKDIRYWGADPEKLKDHRTRIDVYRWPKGFRTGLNAHDGHESVLVLDGTIEMEFEANGKSRKQTLCALDSADAEEGEPCGVVFTSWITHQITCRTSSRIIVARPTESGVGQIQRHGHVSGHIA